MELCPRKEVLKREKFPNTRKHSHWRVCGEPWNLRGQHKWEEKQINNYNPQITCPMVTPPVEKQCRGLNAPLASGAGQGGTGCIAWGKD